MAVIVRLPGYLQPFADGREAVEVEGATVGAALDSVGRRYPGVRDRVINERGELRPHINLFLGERNTRFEHGLATAVPDGGEVLILAAVSGG